MADLPLLLTAQEFRNILDVSDSSKNKTIVERSIRDAQNDDLMNLLGFNFYSEILNNAAEPEIITLLDGGAYQYDGKSYFNPGLKLVIAYYAYSRYILNNAQKDTAFGIVQKQMQDSQAPSTSRLKEIAKQHNQTAFQYWAQVEVFLNRNTTDYPLWYDDCTWKNKSSSSFRVGKISR
jgi:hypothetical protein